MLGPAIILSFLFLFCGLGEVFAHMRYQANQDKRKREAKSREISIELLEPDIRIVKKVSVEEMKKFLVQELWVWKEYRRLPTCSSCHLMIGHKGECKRGALSGEKYSHYSTNSGWAEDRFRYMLEDRFGIELDDNLKMVDANHNEI